MWPILFELPFPEWLQKLLPFLPEQISFYSYGIFIGLGILSAYWYCSKEFAKYGWSKDRVSNLIIYIIIASFVGGKIFFYLEDLSIYIENPSKLIPTGSGFVFYGSLLFAIPTLLYFFKKWDVPMLEGMDVMAVATPLLHGIGRIGCFLAGCCHGKECDLPIGVTYNHPLTSADPMNVPLYPTQIFEAIFLFFLAAFIHFILKKKRPFSGQLFLIYVMLYSLFRSVNEIYRGDEERGFIFGDWLSHSQFISALIFIAALGIYIYLRKKTKLSS